MELELISRIVIFIGIVKLILFSQDDPAGSKVARIIHEGFGFEEDGPDSFRKGDVALLGSAVNVKDLKESPLSPEVCIVASRHRSESGKPTLTCHPTGNFGRAELGGSNGVLQLTEAGYLRQCLLLLKDKKEAYGLEFEVSMEVTHHGPTDLPFPLLYVEVGSTPAQWQDLKACKAVAETVMELMKGVEEKPSAIGFGGPHYAPNFNAAARELAVGHIMPKYATEHLDEAMARQMAEKTRPRPGIALLDWKGLKGDEKDRLKDIAAACGLETVKTSEVK